MATNNDKHDYEKLNRVLTTPDKPDNLEQVLLDNFEKQIIDEDNAARKKKRNRFFFSSSLAASVFVGLGIMLRVYVFSSPVALAYEHAQEERLVSGQLDGGYQQWMSNSGISVPVNAEAIVLSKNCSIGDIKAKHLRFELKGSRQDTGPGTTLTNNKSVINLFVHIAGNKQIKVQDTSGDINGQKWVLFKPNQEIEVLVLYENDAYKRQVDDIVKSMFPEQVFPDRGKTVI